LKKKGKWQGGFAAVARVAGLLRSSDKSDKSGKAASLQWQGGCAAVARVARLLRSSGKSDRSGKSDKSGRASTRE
jgi:hypothetical protein